MAQQIFKQIFYALGGVFGYIVAEFRPTFPLIVVMVLFVLYDAWSAYQLDRRVHVMFPRKTKRHEAKFTSFAFGKVVRKTIPERLIVILLAFVAEKYVFVHVSVPLSYVATGVIIFEQGLSALENNASCRTDERESKFWRTLSKWVVDKTERHFDINLDEYKEVTEEQIESMRKQVAAWDERAANDDKNR